MVQLLLWRIRLLLMDCLTDVTDGHISKKPRRDWTRERDNIMLHLVNGQLVPLQCSEIQDIRLQPPTHAILLY